MADDPVAPVAGPAGSAQTLVDALDFDIEPVRLSPLYRVGLVVVAGAMLLLPLVYVALVLLAAYGVWFHATHNYVYLFEAGATRARAVAYVAPIVAGSLGVLFMVKPLLAPRPRGPEPRTLGRDEQPLLYAYVERLCQTIGAPAPRRIDVEMQVNASASFRRGVVSFFGTDLVLTVGLPLTGGMTLGQWTGVLAHEFGHFTQGAAMRLTYLIGSVNHWFSRVVYERDAWDARLEREIRETRSGWGQIVLQVAKGFIWLSRRILWGLMMAGLAVSSFLSRQMEYDADLHQARVSGSELFRATHVRVSLLGQAWLWAIEHVNEMWKEGRLVEDLVGLTVAQAESVTSPETLRVIERQAMGPKTGLLDTHPSTADRVRAIERLDLPARLHDDAPASLVFAGFDDLCKEATLDFYRTALGGAVDAGALVPTEQAVAELGARHAQARALGAFFYFGTGLLTVGFHPGDVVEAATDGAPERLEELRRRQRSAVDEVKELGARSAKAIWRRDTARTLMRASDAGFDLPTEGLGLDEEDLHPPEAALEAALAECEAAEWELSAHAAVASERARIALAVAPTVRDRLSEHSAHTLERLPELLAVLRRLTEQWRVVRRIQGELGELDMLLPLAGPTVEPGPMLGQLQDLWTSLSDDVSRLRSGVAGLTYPYAHAQGATPLGDYLAESSPPPGHAAAGPAARAAFARVSDLYARLWSDLAALVLEVERALSPDAAEDGEPTGSPRAAAPEMIAALLGVQERLTELDSAQELERVLEWLRGNDEIVGTPATMRDLALAEIAFVHLGADGGDADRASACLDRLQAYGERLSEHQRDVNTLIKAQLLRALACHRAGDRPGALEWIDRFHDSVARYGIADDRKLVERVRAAAGAPEEEAAMDAVRKKLVSLFQDDVALVQRISRRVAGRLAALERGLGEVAE